MPEIAPLGSLPFMWAGDLLIVNMSGKLYVRRSPGWVGPFASMTALELAASEFA